MRYLIALGAALCLGVLAGERPTAAKGPSSEKGPAPPASAASVAEVNDLVIGEPVRYQNLTIFPVSSKVARNEDPYITLDEGLRSKQVEVFEVGAARPPRPPAVRNRPAPQGPRPGESGDLLDQLDNSRPGTRSRPGSRPPRPAADNPVAEPRAAEGQHVRGDVNRVMVLNRSDKPLYLMPGEMIFGGKQDRCIGDEMLVFPGDKPTPVPVYCVEHGRWSGRSTAETASMLDLITSSAGGQTDRKTLHELSNEADRGKFVASAGSLSKSGRRTVQEGEGQQKVWDEVGQANARAGVRSKTGAFTENYASRKMVDQLKTYLDKLEKPVAERRQVVGVVVAINGKPDTMDVFQSTPLFLKLWPKLLKSYALDAATAAGAADANKPCALADAASFLRGAVQAEVTGKTETRGTVAITRRQSRGMVSFSADAAGGYGASAHDKAAKKAASSGGMGGMHSSAYAK